MSADAIGDVVASYARPLGWDLAPHDLRRTFAKLACSGQEPLEQMQLALGNQNIQTHNNAAQRGQKHTPMQPRWRETG